MKQIKLIFRKPFPNSFSIEYLFDNLLTEFLYAKLPVSKIELPNPSMGLMNRIKNVLSVSKYHNQIIHITGDVHYAILGAWRSKRILTIHDVTFMDRHKGIKKRIYKWFWISLPVFFAHKVIVISEATKNEVLKYINPKKDKISVIYDFIDSIYQPVDRVFNRDKPRLLQIGTAFNKNLLNLIESIKGVKCKLIIIGPLDQQATLLLNKNSIEFENHINLSIVELHTKYLESDILIYASFKEGFGMPILEAQSTGLPVITSNCSSMPEVAGNAAVYVDPQDTSSIKDGILSIIENDNLRTDLIFNGYENVKRFSKAKIANAYVSVYKTMSNPL